MAQNLLRHLGIVDDRAYSGLCRTLIPISVGHDRDDTHDFAAFGAAQRVHMPDFADDVSPLFGRTFGRRRRREAGFAHHHFGRQATLPDAAGLVPRVLLLYQP